MPIREHLLGACLLAAVATLGGLVAIWALGYDTYWGVLPATLGGFMGGLLPALKAGRAG